MAAGRLAALGTLSSDGGPLTTLVAYADDGGGRPLFLLSGLAEHTRNLVARPLASVLIVDAADGATLNRARVTLTGRVRWLEGDEGDSARARFLSAHPEAAQYASLPDFRPATLEVVSVRFVGGFARAATPSVDEYLR